MDLSSHDPAIRNNGDTGEVVHGQGDFDACLFDVEVAYIRSPISDNGQTCATRMSPVIPVDKVSRRERGKDPAGADGDVH